MRTRIAAVAVIAAAVGVGGCGQPDETTPEGLLAEADKAAIAAKRHNRTRREQRRAA